MSETDAGIAEPTGDPVDTGAPVRDRRWMRDVLALTLLFLTGVATGVLLPLHPGIHRSTESTTEAGGDVATAPMPRIPTEVPLAALPSVDELRGELSGRQVELVKTVDGMEVSMPCVGESPSRVPRRLSADDFAGKTFAVSDGGQRTELSIRVFSYGAVRDRDAMFRGFLREVPGGCHSSVVVRDTSIVDVDVDDDRPSQPGQGEGSVVWRYAPGRTQTIAIYQSENALILFESDTDIDPPVLDGVMDAMTTRMGRMFAITGRN